MRGAEKRVREKNDKDRDNLIIIYLMRLPRLYRQILEGWPDIGLNLASKLSLSLSTLCRVFFNAHNKCITQSILDRNLMFSSFIYLFRPRFILYRR